MTNETHKVSKIFKYHQQAYFGISTNANFSKNKHVNEYDNLKQKEIDNVYH